MIAAVLGSALSRHAQMAAAVDGAVALPKLDGAYVPGTRYAHFAIRLIEAGLTETLQGCKAAITGYVGTIAASLHFDTKPDAFSALKRACTARLEAIAVPLEKIYHAEGLGSALGAIGAEFHGKVVRLDDEGLFPMAPTFLRATRPSMVSYEDFILPAIWLVSMALDAGFVLSLKRVSVRARWLAAVWVPRRRRRESAPLTPAALPPDRRWPSSAARSPSRPPPSRAWRGCATSSRTTTL
jgi:hypothetical protein